MSFSLFFLDSLVIPAAELTDAGLYTCHAENQVNILSVDDDDNDAMVMMIIRVMISCAQVVNQIKLEVRTVPSRVTNMSVHTNSVFAIGGTS